MKFPRSVKILGSQSDAAPYAAVFFLLVLFLLLAALLPTPGLNLSLVDLPVADNLAGTAQPSLAVAIDSSNRFYYANQLIDEAQLKFSLKNAVHRASGPITLVIQADKSISYGQVLRLTLLARDAGITNALLATRPGTTDQPPGPP